VHQAVQPVNSQTQYTIDVTLALQHASAALLCLIALAVSLTLSLLTISAMDFAIFQGSRMLQIPLACISVVTIKAVYPPVLMALIHLWFIVLPVVQLVQLAQTVPPNASPVITGSMY
jgi:hypothetical protein